MSQTIETDYLVVGAGGMGMAFADEILTHTNASIAIVDKNHRPGGHWNFAYPFVRLHQTSTCYGVNSTDLGGYRVDEVGLNKGCYELASGSEVVAYFDNVMRRRFLPSGRVTYLPMCEYRDDGTAVNIVSGAETTFRARKIVDSTYLNVTVPSQRPPTFAVEDGALAVAVNELPRVAAQHDNFVIVGSGKTGMDACLFLLTNGIDPERVTWIMPADAWMFDRFSVNPGRKFSDPITQYAIGILESALAAKNYDDFFAQLVERDLVRQLDPAFKPGGQRLADPEDDVCVLQRLRLGRGQQIHLQAEGMGGGGLALDLGPAFLVTGQPQPAIALPARRLPGFLFQRIVKLHRIAQKLRDIRAGAQLPHQPRGVKRGARCQLLAFQQHHVGPSQLGQVIGG